MPNLSLKEDRISLRTPPELKKMLTSAAALSNVSLTDFLLTAARKAAEQVLLDANRISLNHAEWDRFMDLLDHPPKPNTALKNAMQRHQHLLD
ncbi:DUF1778 domain-containing protein [Thiolinea disciformis]|uniref:type II toxin-antitoxin system TacA family antitoxin n=1 Tax=Thiolinea disciformis TaxID=125614 RepID=UPI00035E83D7|nr:DUF1778 domain-containing protein [Thiolinea disciformis]